MSERLKGLCLAFLYSLLFFSVLAVAAAFVLSPVFTFLKTGSIGFPLIQELLGKWLVIILACSVVNTVAVYAWAEWRTWRDGNGM